MRGSSVYLILSIVKLRLRLVFATLSTGLMIALAVLSAPKPASALTKEQARENCRNMVGIGKGYIQSCMGGQKGEGLREACRAKSYAAVGACMKAALNKANGRANVAIAVDDGKTKKEVINLGNALPAGFVPPPRTISDIAAILDNEKPDPAALAKLRQEADDSPANGLSAADLAAFYFYRGNSRSLLGRPEDAIADGDKAKGFARAAGDQMLFHRTEHFIGMQRKALGDLKSTIAIYLAMIRGSSTPRLEAWHIVAIPSLMQAYVQVGDIPQAEGQLRRITALVTKARTSGNPGWRQAYATKGRMFESFFDNGRAIVLEARGQYREAEEAYKRAADFIRAWSREQDKFDNSWPVAQILVGADSLLLNAARMKAKQGRLAEAEVDARAVLLARLKEQGKYNPNDHPVCRRARRRHDRSGALWRCREAAPLRA